MINVVAYNTIQDVINEIDWESGKLKEICDEYKNNENVYEFESGFLSDKDVFDKNLICSLEQHIMCKYECYDFKVTDDTEYSYMDIEFDVDWYINNNEKKIMDMIEVVGVDLTIESIIENVIKIKVREKINELMSVLSGEKQIEFK